MKNLLFTLSLSPLLLAAAPLTLVSPENGATMPTLSDGQKAYLHMPRAERVEYFASKSKRKEMKALGYYPQPIVLAWKGGRPGRPAASPCPWPLNCRRCSCSRCCPCCGRTGSCAFATSAPSR